MDAFTTGKNNLGVVVCDYPYDLQCAVNESTDTLREPFASHGEYLGFKHNLRFTTYVSQYFTPMSSYRNINDTGVIKMQTYFPTDRWVNPTTKQVQVIPDYNSNLWTVSGAEFFNVTIGASKQTRYPNHGQQMFDLSNGVYGMDSVRGMGTSKLSELYDLFAVVDSYANVVSGKSHSAISWRNGVNTASVGLMNKYLYGRVSQLLQANLNQDGYTSNGINLGYPNQSTSRPQTMVSYPTVRYMDMIESLGMGTQAQVDAYVIDQIAKTKADKGAWMGFIHWHTGDQYLAHYFEILGNNFGDDCWKASADEIIEYRIYRDLIKGVASWEDDGLIKFQLIKTDNFRFLTVAGISEEIINRLTVPISIKIDLTGTILAGKDIAVKGCTVYKISANIFTIQVPIEVYTSINTFKIVETSSPVYVDRNRPTGSFSVVGTQLTVTTNIPTRAVLFSITDSAPTVAGRDNTLSTTHVFTVTGGSYQVGIISGENLMSLLV